MLNNALIRITHEQRWNRELYAKGVPPFLLSSPEFREKFIQFADKDARDKEAIRRQIISEATSLHCPKNAEKSRMEEFGSIYELLSGSIVRYVQKEMPKTMLIFHGARHMAVSLSWHINAKVHISVHVNYETYSVRFCKHCAI